MGWGKGEAKPDKLIPDHKDFLYHKDFVGVRKSLKNLNWGVIQSDTYFGT